MATIGNLWINIKSNTKGLAKGLSKSKGMLGKFGKFAASPAGLAVAAFAALTAGVFAAAKAVKFAVGEFMKFEAAMAEVKSILLDVSNSDFARLEDSAKKLGATTSFTAEQAAKGMTNLARAGFTTNEILSATPAVLDLAAATGMELAEAADIAAVAVRGFGLEASQTTHVADVLALAASKTNTTVQEMGDAFSYVAPVASQLGFSIEETSAMLGKLADAGIKGSKGGTALRTVMLKMATEISEKGTPALREYLLEGHGLVENFEKFGKLGVTAVGVLSGVVEETDALTVAMEQAVDVVGKMADIRLNTLEGDTKLLTSAISGLAIAVGSELSPAFRTGTQAATGFFAGLTEGFNALNTKAKEGMVQINLWSGLLMVVADIIMTITAVVKFLWNVLQYVFYKLGALAHAVLGGIIKLTEMMARGMAVVMRMFGGEPDMTGVEKLHAMAESMAADALKWNDTAVAQAEEGVKAVTSGLIDAYKAQYKHAIGAGEELGAKTIEGVVKGIEDGAPAVKDEMEKMQDGWGELIDEGKKLTTTLEDQIDYFGMTAAEMLIAKASSLDLTSAVVAGTLALEEELQALKDADEARKEAIKTADALFDASLKVIESIRTDQQVYDDEVAKLKKMYDAELLTILQFNKAVNNLKTSTEEDIEVNVNIVTKGIVEGLQSAMGSIKIAGQVNKTEQLAQKQVETSKKIEQVMTAVKENTAKSLDRTEDIANRTKDVVSKLGGTIDTDVKGLESMMDTTVAAIGKLSSSNSMSTTEDLLKDIGEVSGNQLTELQKLNEAMRKRGSTGVLT